MEATSGRIRAFPDCKPDAYLQSLVECGGRAEPLLAEHKDTRLLLLNSRLPFVFVCHIRLVRRLL